MPKHLPRYGIAPTAAHSTDADAAYETGIESALTGCACPWPADSHLAARWHDGRQDGLRDLPKVWAAPDMPPPTPTGPSGDTEADQRHAAVLAKIREATNLASGDSSVPSAMVDMMRDIEGLLKHQGSARRTALPQD